MPDDEATQPKPTSETATNNPSGMPSTKATRAKKAKPTRELRPRGVRSRVNGNKKGKDGAPLLRAYIPAKYLDLAMNRKKLGAPFSEFVRKAWAERPKGELPLADLPEGRLICRGIRISKEEVDSILFYEKLHPGEFDRYVYSRLRRKLKL